ncbi:MAG TPA: SDR family NAD(P)-dependent oxidoreductase [Solirubrobacteraceae bacterium]|jgi:NAD(P)-dependent dehydrogenase (short-subunit alcohol dehydrogenase family)|nr:SDR family NAD(P)-dependent oxidoreductase [Solirubrobacteraceae bacterium]
MAKQLRPLNGTVVAITGGARGIGRATAAALVAQGARVAIGDLGAALTARVADELGGGVIGLSLDVTSRESFSGFLDQVERQLGPLDVLVNNAGIMAVGDFVSQQDAVSTHVLDVNLGGTMLGSKLALERMLRRGDGRIINLGALPGRVLGTHASSYAATGGAIRAFSRALRAELQGTGVSVHVVLAGPTETEMLSGLKSLPVFGPLSADAVAAAVVRVLRGGRPDIGVPGLAGWIMRLLLARIVPDKWLPAQPDALERATYEARIAPPERAAEDPAATVASAAASVADAVRSGDLHQNT